MKLTFVSESSPVIHGNVDDTDVSTPFML